MSSGPSHKMYYYEVPPPAGVWENIAAELDEAEESKNLTSKLYNVQALPPVGIWENIAAELNEAALFQHVSSKLSNIQLAPPAGIWESIAADLDESPLVSTLAERLQNTEVAPPANAWNKIVAELDTVQEAAIPERRKLSPFVRYAAAASIIGLLAFAALQLFKNKNTEDNGAVATGTTTPEKTNTVTPPVAAESTTNNIPETIAAAEEIRNDAALEASKKTYAKLDKPVSAKMDMAAAFYFNDAIPSGTTRGLGDIFAIDEDEPIVNNNNNINSRYIMLMTPDGNIIRMSKKLSDLVCCVSGEEQDADCMHQLKQWKDKLANSYAGHSPGNFMDVFSLINSLQENNN